MKKITLWLFVLFTCWQINAQVSSYSFTQSTDTYNQITGGLLLGNTSSDDQRFVDSSSPLGGTTTSGVGIQIGFDFTYNGDSFDRLAINNNGWISLGKSTITPSVIISSTSSYNPLSSVLSISPIFLRNRIAGIGDDLQAQSGSELRIETIGVAPNRICVIQWSNYREYGTAGQNLNFQIRLNETSNDVEVVYGTMIFTSNSETAQIGLGGTSSSDFNNRNTTSDWNSTISGLNNTDSCTYSTSVTAPVSGLVFRWSPPVLCTGNPVAGSVLPASQTLVTGQTPATLVATGYTSGVSGLAFQWEESDDNGVNDAWANAVGGSGATTASYIPPAFATTIYYRLVVTCTSSSSSDTTASVILNSCDAITTLPHSESFNATSLPSCWSTSLLTGTTNWATDDLNDGVPSPQSGARFMGKSWVGNDDALLVSPEYDLTSYSSDQVRLNVWIYRNTVGLSTDRTTFYANTNPNISGATQLLDVSLLLSEIPVETAVGWYNYTVIVPNSIISGGNFYIVARGRTSSSLDSYGIGFDDYSLEIVPAGAPACVAITSPANGAINVSNPTFTWASSVDATGYYINVGTSPGGTDVANGDDMGTVTSFTVPEAEPGTTYYATVIPFNASGTATGCTESRFTTCASSTDFVQDFEATTGAIFPDCWSKVGTTGAAYTQASTEITGARNLYMYSSSTTSRPVVAIQAVSNANAGTHRMRMKVRGNFSAGETIELGYLTNPADATSFTAINSIVTNTTVAANAQDFVTVPVPTGMPTGDVVFALRTGTALLSVLIDNVAWELIPAVVPSCVTITSPVNAALNVVNSRVTWASDINATGYKLSVGTNPAATDVLNMQDVGNVLSYAFTSDPSTTYYVTVYPYNPTGQATGCTEISFTTCDALTPDVLETFDTFLPSCWQEADGGNSTTGPVTFGSGAWAVDGFANSGATGAIKVNIDFLGDNGWVISPIVEIPATGYELKFDAASTDWGQTTLTDAWEADDKIEVLVSTTGLTNWTVLYTYDTTNQPGATAATNVIDLDAYGGQNVRFAFRGVEGTTAGAADIDFFIDNFNVRLSPSTVPSCATVTATPDPNCGNFSNTLTWTAASGANGYRINVGSTPGGTQVANNVDLGTVLSYSFTGTMATTYYYTVVPYNVVGPATGCAEQSFTTNANGCYCVSAPTSVDVSGITNVQVVSTNFPNTVTTAPVYNNHTATIVDMARGVNNNVQITFDVTSFGTTYDYYTVIWVDFNDDYVFSATEIVYSGVSPTTTPTLLNASFVMPSTAPLGNHRMRIVATDNQQIPVNPCYSGTYGETADFTINVIAPSCTPPAATSSVVFDCTASQFSVAVNVSALGNGSPSISNGTTTWPVTSTGVVTAGPFNFGTPVTLTLLHGTSATCDIPLGTFNYGGCPPVNDNCTNATVLTPGGVFATNPLVGTNQFASASVGAPAPGCASYSGGDVWYSLVVPTSGNITIESATNAGTAITDTGLAVYSGTCGSLALVSCDDDGGTGAFSLVSLTSRTPGEVLLVRVWEFGGGTEGTFKVSAYDASLSNEEFDNTNFLAYPNPVRDVLNVNYSSEISAVRVLNLLGQEVISQEVNTTSAQIDMSQLSIGTYIVNVTVGDTIKVIKVVKQ